MSSLALISGWYYICTLYCTLDIQSVSLEVLSILQTNIGLKLLIGIQTVFIDKASIYKDTSGFEIDQDLYKERLGDTGSFKRDQKAEEGFICINNTNSKMQRKIFLLFRITNRKQEK